MINGTLVDSKRAGEITIADLLSNEVVYMYTQNKGSDNSGNQTLQNVIYNSNGGSGTWTEGDLEHLNTDGIVAGAIGGDGLKGADGLPKEKQTFEVTGGKLTIDGKGTERYSLASGTSVAAAGAWGESTTQTINVHDNEITITGTGYIDKGTGSYGTRGAVYGAWASSTKGQAIASSNHITVENRTDATSRAAASHGFTGAHAQGHKGATASGNTVDIEGISDTQRQVLSLSGSLTVIGGEVKALADSTNSGTGVYNASQNIVTLTNVSAGGSSTNEILIAGGHLIVGAADATKTSLVAQGNKVEITGAAFTFGSGASGGAIRGAQHDVPATKGFQNTTFSNNSVKLTDATISLNDQDIEIVGATSNSDGVASLSGNSVELVDSKITGTEAAGFASVWGASIGSASKTVTVSQNSVKITDSVNTADTTTNTIKSDFIAGANIVNTYKENDAKGQITATGNSVEIGSDVVIDVASATGSSGIVGASVSASGDKLTSLDMSDNSVTIGGKVSGNVFAARYVNAGGDFAEKTTPDFRNNVVTLKAGGQVQSGSLVGGVGKDSVITIENGSKYIANNTTTQDIASDVINIAGTIEVQDGNTLEISGFYKDGDVNASEFHDNLTSVSSSAVIKNASVINLYGKAVVDQGATLTGTAADSKIVVNAHHAIKAEDSLIEEADKVAGAGQGTLAIYNSTLQSYLKADKVLSQTTDDSAGMVQLTSGGVLELRDTTNIDIATAFNFVDSTSEASGRAGAIVVDANTTNGGSTIRGNELTISQKLAGNGATATAYSGLDTTKTTTAGIKVEANVLHLGDSDLESWQSAEIKFGSATFRDKLTFSAVNNGLSGTDSAGQSTIINDGYHLVSETIGDHYRVVKTQADTDKNSTVAYYEAQDGVIEGDATIMGDSGSITIRNGNYTADGALTIASGGNITVGAADFDNDGTPDTGTHEGTGLLNAPDATLTLGQELTFDLNAASADAKVTVDGSHNGRYDAETAAETLGDDRYVMLDPSKLSLVVRSC